jgi:hypothetical protein
LPNWSNRQKSLTIKTSAKEENGSDNPIYNGSANGNGGNSNGNCRVLSLKNSKGRVAYFQQNLADAYTSTPTRMDVPELTVNSRHTDREQVS